MHPLMGKEEEGQCQRHRLTKIPKLQSILLLFKECTSTSLRSTKRITLKWSLYEQGITKTLLVWFPATHEECGDHGWYCSRWFIATPVSSQVSSRHIWSAVTLACMSEASRKSKWKLKWRLYIFRRICSVWTPALGGSRVFCKPKICSLLLVCWLNILVTKNFKQEKI